MTRQSFNVSITIFKRLVRSMEKDFCHKYQLWKLFRRIRNQTVAHAQKGVKCPLRTEEIFPPAESAESWLVNSNFRRGSHMQGAFWKNIFRKANHSTENFGWKFPARNFRNFGYTSSILENHIPFVTQNFLKCNPEFLLKWKVPWNILAQKDSIGGI